MAKEKRICVACGKEYYYCPRCAEDADKPRWMFAFHDEVCKTVFEAVSSVCNGNLTHEEAHDKLKDLISEADFKKYSKNTQKELKKIFKTTVSSVVSDEDDVKDTEVSSLATEEVVEEVPVVTEEPEKTTFMSRKKKRR